jgi:beta-lactamase superfamily II metal-dependent hydrolase
MDDYQITYLPVGDGSKGGDAIALRFGNLRGGRRDEQVVMIIDGGTKESGAKLVDHVQNCFGTNSVDIVLATHPDSDHVSGLTEVLNTLYVGELWMHQPWEVAPSVKQALNQPYTHLGLSNYVKASLGQASDLAKIAREKEIPIFEPYAGLTRFDGMLQIIGPSEEYYQSLVPNFRSTPTSTTESALSKLLGGAYDSLKEGVKKVLETLEIETLKDGNEHYSAENNSSAILLLTVGDRKVLFTGDADADALTLAADYCEGELDIPLSDLSLMHVPHHGSKQNVGPTILNRIRTRKAQISAPAKSDKHPHQSVINAFVRRESQVFGTMGSGITHHSGHPLDGWTSPVEPLQFVGEFED